MRSLVLALAVFAAAPAVACINDREVENQEREFRGRYPDAAPATPDTGLVTAGLPIASGVLGALLLAGALRRASQTPRA